MASKTITALPAAAALGGTEPLETVQGGVSVKTTAQDVADLAPAGPTLPLSIGEGGSGQTTAQAALDAFFAGVVKGSIIVGDGTHNTAVGVGANGDVLTADSTQSNGVKWAAAIGGVSIGDALGGGTAGENVVVGPGPVLAQTPHLESGGGAPTPSYALGDGGSIASFAGTDSGGLIGVLSGGTGGAGDIATVTFATAYTGNPAVVLTPADVRTANLGAYTSAVSSTAFTIAIAGAVPPTTNISWSYAVVGAPK